YRFVAYKWLWAQIKWKIPEDYGFADDYLGWIQCRIAIRAIAALCSQKGIGQPVLVIFPYFSPGKWNTDNYPLTEVYKKVKKAARKAGMHVLDLTPIFLSADRDLKEFWALPLDFHPNEEAHLIAAASIENFLIKNRILDSRINGKDF
ncbi:MAG: SGNH/GDSL hydrolase family protein, partial [Candidatus Omnitrophica bacterium]|nr:SGNH/GDSL hydrolase family protein [Candidatus Omnitrophota bacterium]